MTPATYIELSKSALQKNINYLKKRIGRAEFVSIIKGNAYGHGIEAFLPLAEQCGVRRFAVSDYSEADRAFKVKKPNSKIVILNMIDNDDIEEAVERGISFYVFNFDRLQKTIEVSKKLKIKANIHLELETGLNRTGFNQKEIAKVIEMIGANAEHLNIEALCTHYAGAESIASYYRIQNQKQIFRDIASLLETNSITATFHSTACSAAALTYPDTIMNMVRFGIAHYGFWPSNETRMYNMLSDEAHFTRDPLKRVLTWKSKVISIKIIPKGEFVGYGNNYLASSDITVAVIPVGYYHGYSRNLSNLGQVLLRNQKVNVIGMVNMNMIMVDVSHINGISINDEAVIIGKQGKQEISVASFSEQSNYVNYEMLVRLPYEIPRIIVE